MADRAGSEFKVIHGEPWVVNADLNALDADGWEVVGVSRRRTGGQSCCRC